MGRLIGFDGRADAPRPPTISRAQHPPLYLLSLLRQPTKLLNEANSTSRRRLRELALGRVGRTRRSGSRNTRRRALSGGPDQTPWHRSSRALNVARFPIFTADQTRCRGRGPGRAAVCRADEKQIEYKSLRTRRELATAPAWVLSRGIEMAKTENRKPRSTVIQNRVFSGE